MTGKRTINVISKLQKKVVKTAMLAYFVEKSFNGLERF